MKSIQLIKQVNNTELGKGGTHETYILIPQDLNVSDLFEENNVKLPFRNSFHAGDSIRQFAFKQMQEEAIGLGYSHVYTCGEPGFEETPCITQLDIDILGLTETITLEGNKKQRSNCSCPANKRQLISWEESKKKCGHECLYCYMKND